LVDPAEKKVQIEKVLNRDFSRTELLWCGGVDGYKRDILFLIDALAQLTTPAGQKVLLRIVGPCSENGRADLSAYVRSKNISVERLDIAGFVSESQLWDYCTQANALLMPLWEDGRSSTRFPTKLGQYLAAGRPIVTAQVGEIKHFLMAETAVFYLTGDAAGLAYSLDTLLTGLQPLVNGNPRAPRGMSCQG
jgi:glycosyltransferase involved in cell wall biosynthesis